MDILDTLDQDENGPAIEDLTKVIELNSKDNDNEGKRDGKGTGYG